MILIGFRRRLLDDLLTGLHHLVGPLLGSVLPVVLVALLIIHLLELAAVILIGLLGRGC